ncbi:MAG: SpoVA/SpoVAEb family sporulation membrane protein [Desulfitobacterium sp.]|nr:SpoVA/SpoVAEb family sporulation membrane protein [Desulfitobacterium sp.]
MDKIKQILSAFIVGGLFAVLGQFLIVSYSSTGLQPANAGRLTLLTLGVIGGVLFILGIYQKIEKFGAYGAILPFSGLAAAVAGVYEGAKSKTGSSGEGVKAAVSLILYVVGIGTILSTIVAIVAHYTL